MGPHGVRVDHHALNIIRSLNYTIEVVSRYRYPQLQVAKPLGFKKSRHNVFIWPLGPFTDVSVAFVIRRGGALWGISGTFSMRLGMFYSMATPIMWY